MTKRELYDLAINTIGLRKQNSITNSKRRREVVINKIPEILSLEQQLSLSSIKLSKLILSKNSNSTETISQIMSENLTLQEKIETLLVENGFSKTELFPQFYCNACSDTGFILGERCDCYKELVKKLAIEDFNKNSAMALSSFDEFKLTYYSHTPKSANTPSDSEIMSQILKFCVAYSQGFTKTSPSILMIGNTGLGKTHLSLAIASKVIQEGFVVLYGTAQEFFSKIQNEHFGKGQAGVDTMRTILEADLFILDDVGAEYESAFNNATFYNIINSRLNKNKPTIINTNLTLKQIEARYTNRVASRLMTLYKCLKFVGVDVRQLKLKEKQ